MEIILTLGVSGSGKSNFVNKFLKEQHHQLICLDDIRLALGDIYELRTEPVVRLLVDVMARSYMERGLSIIIDSTCSSKIIAEKWCKLAKEYSYRTIAVYLNTPFQICCERRVKTKHHWFYRIEFFCFNYYRSSCLCHFSTVSCST